MTYARGSGNFAIAYDVATSYSGVQLEFRRADGADHVARTFATAERAWFGDVFFDGEQVAEPLPPEHEPGYALLLDRAGRGRPQAHPRDAHVTIHEYFDPAALLDEARRRSSSAAFASVIGIRIRQRKPAAIPAWDAETRALFAETLARRDDDDPRLVFADALGTRRGGFVVVQCDLARGGLTPAESRARRRTQREQLARHGEEWSRLGGLAQYCRFRRGFVEAAALPRDVLADHYSRVFDAAPHLDSIELDLGPPIYVRSLVDAGVRDGWWPRVRGLAMHASQLGDSVVGTLGTLRALQLGDARPAHAHALVASGQLGNLETLRMPDHDLGDDAFDALMRATPKLRVLAIAGGNQRLVVPDSIRELSTSGVYIPRGIEKLAIRGLTPGASLDGRTSLRSLDLSDGWCSALRELALPALRELRVDASVDDIRAVARRFGAQLELLDVRDCDGVESIADELREVVAGDVWFGTAGSRAPLLVASYLPDEPMWDVGSVELG